MTSHDKSITTEVALLKQSQEIMQNDIKELKNDHKEGLNEIKSLFSGLGSKFVTKTEHKVNTDKIDSLRNDFDWWKKVIGGAIVTTLILSVLDLIIK